jgi:hypothetical protein
MLRAVTKIALRMSLIRGPTNNFLVDFVGVADTESIIRAKRRLYLHVRAYQISSPAGRNISRFALAYTRLTKAP